MIKNTDSSEILVIIGILMTKFVYINFEDKKIIEEICHLLLQKNDKSINYNCYIVLFKLKCPFYYQYFIDNNIKSLLEISSKK